jgi:putative NADH-flavin reductase
MKLAIFGASGGTGRILVDLALAAGHEVVAMARDPASVGVRPGLTVVQGDIRNPESVSVALAGCDAVLSALGSRSLGRDDLLEVGITNILSGMRSHGVRRIIVLGAAGALHDAQKHQTLGRKIFFALIRNTFLKHPMNDSGRQEGILEVSGTDYTVVHPPRLTDGPATGSYRVMADGLPPGGQQISRADVAAFMIRQLKEQAFVRSGPYVAT